MDKLGVFRRAILVRFNLSEEAFDEIKKRAESGDEMAKLIIGGVVEDQPLCLEEDALDEDGEDDEF
jgi:hypothetical protein